MRIVSSAANINCEHLRCPRDMGMRIMNAADGPLGYSHFEMRLRERRVQLRAAIHAALLRGESETYGELAGQVHDVEEEALADLLTDVNFAEITREIEEIRDIEAALQRMASGTFGVCVECGEAIGAVRLEAYPTAKRCLGCQRAYEALPAARRPPKL